MYLKLRPSLQQLQEVVVTGYSGAPQQSTVSGSVSNVIAGRVGGVSISEVSDEAESIRIRGVSTTRGGAPPLLIVDGQVYAGQLADISPTDIANIQVLKGASATAIYGTRAANGVMVITTKAKSGAGAPKSRLGPAGPELPDVPTGDPRLALRRHFRDYAWWRPTLSTNAQGRAHTEVVLPDDITSWDTFVLGSDGHRRVGSTVGQLRSFKGLLA